MGNKATGPSVRTSGPPSTHHPAILTFNHWSDRNGGTQNATVLCNKFYSSANAHRYGIYIDKDQGGETIKWNVLYPNPEGAVEDRSGLRTHSIANNQTTRDASPIASAPPVANAGASKMVIPGVVITLDGSATSRLTGTATGISYRWAQIIGPRVSISSAEASQARIVEPRTDEVTVLGFRLTASDQNGFTTDDVFFGIDPISQLP
jgi:hypothetical protein